MDKKKIIIVIVVFLLLGTMVYSFANPGTGDEQLEGNDPPTEEQGGNQDDGQDDEQQGDSQDDNQDDEQQGDSQDDNQQGNDTPVAGDDDSVEQTTDYLSLAQQAVEKAEQSLAQGDVTEANEAIQDVIENANEDVSDLQNRIENVQNIIDFETLLTQLENKTNNTTNKAELDVVRNDEETTTTTTTLDNLVADLADVETNADKIVSLTNRYNTVLAKLEDTTPPFVDGIQNGEYTKGPVSLTITDDASFTATLNGENYVTGTEIPEDGEYTLIVTDASFNETVITFTIDKTLPKLGAANILVSGDVNEQEVFYATNGDKINVYVRFNEELKHNPTFTLINNGKKYVIADEDVVVRSFDDGQYQYSILFEITEDVDMTDGEITMLVSNIEDLAGNKYQDINKPSNGHIVYLDRTLEYNTLGIAENDPDENPKYVKNGDSIRVLVYFKEELAVLPKVKINGVEYDTHYASQSSNPNNNSYAYHLDLPITEELNLPQGAIKFEVYGYEDKAGNKGATLTNKDITYEQYDFVIYDSNKSEIKVDNLNELGYTNNGNVTITDNNSFNVVVKINGEEKHSYSGDKYKRADLSFLGEGKYEIIVTDAAGNVSTIVFIYDTTLAARVYSTVDFDGTGITPKVEGNRKTYYVNNGTSFVFRMQFTEQLSENPILNVGNKTVELELVEKFVTNEGKYIYQGTVEINEEDNFADGSLPLILSNVKDLAGNVTLDEAVLNQTITSNDRTVVIDNTPSTAKPLYILARDDASYRLSISDGEYLRVEANFNEELSKKPTLTVGSQSIEFDRCNFNSDETRYVCVADIKIDNSIARLVEGKNIPFTVTNIYDLAGNSSELNNDDVTDYYRGNELVYSNVKFENPFVSMSFHNSTNYKLNEENNNTDLSVTEAKVGDTVRVFVRFNQDIDIENFKPTIVIGGVAKELNLSNIYNDGTKDYGADITITKEMNLKFNEEIPFVIKNIVLKNGNNLPNLSQDDITSTNLSGVIYIGE